MTDIFITDWNSISPLGSAKTEIWENYLLPKSFIEIINGEYKAQIAAKSFLQLTDKFKILKYADPTVLMAVWVAQTLRYTKENCGINIGSSRGATTQLEHLIQDFQNHKSTPVHSSPYTTLGNISALVAHILDTNHAAFDHSITCSTSLNAIVNATAWLSANMADNFIVGGSEAPLTDFTLAQMQAMKIYANDKFISDDFPCKAGDLNKTYNGMVLGEGCALLSLSKSSSQAIAKISGVGVGMEKIDHASSISKTGIGLQKSMRSALGHRETVDVIISHTPGTKAGDRAEWNAIQHVFSPDNMPLVTNNKWKIGHTFGASGALSVAFGLQMMEHNTFIGLPWEKTFIQHKPISTILVNSVGFGGNSTSVLIEKIEN